MINIICLICNKTFQVRNYRKNTAKFCSYVCAGKYKYFQVKDSFVRPMSGENHPMWKGGKTLNTQGYVLIYSPNHPYKDNRNCVREHRLVMEKHLGRFLLPGEVVHHKNEKKDDNRLENLQLLKKSEHDRISAYLRKKKGKIVRNCLFCKNPFSTYPSLKRIKCCSVSCRTSFRWKGGKKNFGR